MKFVFFDEFSFLQKISWRSFLLNSTGRFGTAEKHPGRELLQPRRLRNFLEVSISWSLRDPLLIILELAGSKV